MNIENKIDEKRNHFPSVSFSILTSFERSFQKPQKEKDLPLSGRSFLYPKKFNSYFTLATIALKASGWLTAKSANTLRLISIPAACKAPIKREYDIPSRRAAALIR